MKKVFLILLAIFVSNSTIKARGIDRPHGDPDRLVTDRYGNTCKSRCNDYYEGCQC